MITELQRRRRAAAVFFFFRFIYRHLYITQIYVIYTIIHGINILFACFENIGNTEIAVVNRRRRISKEETAGHSRPIIICPIIRHNYYTAVVLITAIMRSLDNNR